MDPWSETRGFQRPLWLALVFSADPESHHALLSRAAEHSILCGLGLDNVTCGLCMGNACGGSRGRKTQFQRDTRMWLVGLRWDLSGCIPPCCCTVTLVLRGEEPALATPPFRGRGCWQLAALTWAKPKFPHCSPGPWRCRRSLWALKNKTKKQQLKSSFKRAVVTSRPCSRRVALSLLCSQMSEPEEKYIPLHRTWGGCREQQSLLLAM